MEIFHLDCASRPSDIPIKSQQISILSRNLRRLDLIIPTAFIVFNELVSGKNFPFPQLETLKLVNTSRNANLKVPLPRTLKKLTLGSEEFHLRCLALSLLPPGITEMECVIDALERPSDGSGFPRELRELKITFKTPVLIFSLLPPGTQKLAISQPGYVWRQEHIGEWEAFSRLRLLYFSFSPFLGRQQLQFVPQTLETLIVNTNESSKVKVKEPQCLDILSPLFELPFKVMQGIWPKKITIAIAQAMPRALEEFEGSVLPEAFHLLPPSSKAVTFEMDLVCDMDPVEGIPPNLERLSIPYFSRHRRHDSPDASIAHTDPSQLHVE